MSEVKWALFDFEGLGLGLAIGSGFWALFDLNVASDSDIPLFVSLHGFSEELFGRFECVSIPCLSLHG